MVTRLTPSNVAQKIPTFEINGRVVVQPHTWYTCPTGKKAIVKGRVQCTGRGAAASANFLVSGILMFVWNQSSNPSSVTNWFISPRSLTTGAGGTFALFEVELAAGEIIETTQNTGTNAEFNLWASVQESPI